MACLEFYNIIFSAFYFFLSFFCFFLVSGRLFLPLRTAVKARNAVGGVAVLVLGVRRAAVEQRPRHLRPAAEARPHQRGPAQRRLLVQLVVLLQQLNQMQQLVWEDNNGKNNSLHS